MAGVTPHARVADQLLELHNLISENTDFADCVAGLKQNEPASFDSVWGSSCALLANSLSNHFDCTLIIAPDVKSCDDLIDDLSTFSKAKVAKFPHCLDAIEARPTVDYEYGDRLRVIKNILSDDTPDVIVATVPALMQTLPSQSAIASHTRQLRIGGKTGTRGIKELAGRTWISEHHGG